MRGLDLFSGIGGITKALEGYVEPVAYCECDRYCRAVLLSRMAEGNLPLAPIWDDVKTLTARDIPPVNILYGGFPCQDISVAGRGAGLEGKRSGLFFEIVRLVGEIRPRFLFLENVPVIRTRGADIVVKELARLGYDCRWGALSAQDVGANHRRERWWLLAHARHEQSSGWNEIAEGLQHPGGRPPRSESPSCSDVADSRLFGPRRSEQQTAGAQQHGKEMANANQSGPQRRNCRILQKRPSECTARTSSAFIPNTKGAKRTRLGPEPRGEPSEPSDGGWWKFEPNVGRVAHGVPFRVDRLRGLGNTVVPAQAREAFERLMGLK